MNFNFNFNKLFKKFTGSKATRIKFDPEKVVVSVNEVNADKKTVATIIEVATETYKQFPAKDVVTKKTGDLYISSQNPKGKSSYADLVSRNVIGAYRLGWIYAKDGKNIIWKAKYFLRANRKEGNFQLEIYQPNSMIKGIDDRK